MTESVAKALRRCDKRGLLVAARSGMFHRGDMVSLSPEIRVPTLFFTGAEDPLFTVEEAQRQTAAIPDCRLVVVEQSAHQSALEAPDRGLPIVRETLARWSPTVREQSAATGDSGA